MNIDSLSSTTTSQKSSLPAEQIDRVRKQKEEVPDELASTPSSAKSAQSEELLGQIKALTDNGTFSVRFETNDNQELVVKVVNSQTGEVIREIPGKELIELTKHLNELRGNIVDTTG
jgi:flagellar protein FlaG